MLCFSKKKSSDYDDGVFFGKVKTQMHIHVNDNFRRTLIANVFSSSFISNFKTRYHEIANNFFLEYFSFG